MFECGSIAEWVQAIGILALVGLAFWAGRLAWQDLKTNREQLQTLQKSSDLQLFSALLREISDVEASYDRGVVKRLPIEAEVEYIRNLVEKGRHASRTIRLCNLMECKPERIDPEALIGMGIERTIARYDRVGFFLLGDNANLNMPPPTWLWTHINMIYLQLHKWIEYRQECKNDKDYYHEDYAKYLVRLANQEEAKQRRECQP